MPRRLACAGALLLLAAAIAACARRDEAVVNVYNWPDYVATDTLANFEARTGIRVRYDVFDTNRVLETKLLAGGSGYDVVVPSAAYVQRLAAAGALQPLDPALLPHRANLDPAIVAAVQAQDPGLRHGIPYVWGTNGFAYNREAILSRMPDAPLDSWDMLLKPAVVSRFADCGVVFFDSPVATVPAVLAWLGRDPNSESAQDLAAAEQALLAVRPFVRYYSNVQQFADLPSGDVCLAFAGSGDAFQARARARESGQAFTIGYTLPREGGQIWFDLMAIPVDAPHARNAHRYIDYILDPRVSADIANATGFATPNLAARALLDPAVRDDPMVFPPPEVMARLFPDPMKGEAFIRDRERMWTRVRTGR